MSNELQWDHQLWRPLDAVVVVAFFDDACQ